MGPRGGTTEATNEESSRTATTRKPPQETAHQHPDGKLPTPPPDQLDNNALLLDNTRSVDKSYGSLGNQYMTLTEKETNSNFI